MIIRAIAPADVEGIADALDRASLLDPGDTRRMRAGEVGIIVIGSDGPTATILRAAGAIQAEPKKARRETADRVERARRLVQDEGWSLRNAAAEVGLAASTLSQALRLRATPGRKRKLGDEDVRRARRLVDEGRTMRAVAKSIGVAESTLYRAMRAAGLDGKSRQ